MITATMIAWAVGLYPVVSIVVGILLCTLTNDDYEALKAGFILVAVIYFAAVVFYFMGQIAYKLALLTGLPP